MTESARHAHVCVACLGERNRVWQTLLDEEVDVLNVDDLWGAELVELE